MVSMRAVSRGFTLIELMVVLAVIALLLTLVAPRYLSQEDKAKETALTYNLHMLRKTIDDFHADKGSYPDTLQRLVEERYLRSIPVDPITGRADTWRLVPPQEGSGVYDIHSGATDVASDGSRYADW
ncbi:competence type IV pilus major pilin ComGC [Pseudomonas sp. zfem003]|uniref:competence type IV pilus major pilin ComGC n=1 Tax=Pseudomonas sp. zfem003 TaxID=3078198 RepID=UPI0039778DFC